MTDGYQMNNLRSIFETDITGYLLLLLQMKAYTAFK
jgi:hypothetical protein